jgi:LPS-assembly lipoprotein
MAIITNKLRPAIYLIAVSLLLILAACGFHLRGQNVLPANLHYVQIDSVTPYGDFESILRRRLTLLGVSVTRTCPAPITLHIINTNLFQDVPTIGGSNQARVHVFYYQVNFEILNACHKPIIPPRQVLTSGAVIINAGTALESTNQIDILRQELQLEAAHMIINILNSPQVSCALNQGFP